VKYDELVREGRIEWKSSVVDGNVEWRPYQKFYLEGRTKQPSNLWTDLEGNKKATRDLRAMFGDKVFDGPKPVALLNRCLEIAASDASSVILDFFAGSGTTAQSVLELTARDSGHRKFILVQLPEPTDREDFPTIAEIAKERVRRVITKLNAEDAGKLDLDAARVAEDRGFRVFKLAESNIRPWQANVAHDATSLTQQLELYVDHIRDDRSADDLLYEILLKSGFPLTTPVESLTMAGKTVASIANGLLLVCLDRQLSLDVVRAMAQRKPQRVVCLDEGFAGNDQLKANAVQIFKTAGVTSFKTV
jgi:adenine-specific DNA-methyltransferase